MPQVLASHAGDLVPLPPVDCRFGGLYVARCAGFDLDEAEHMLVPANQVELTSMADGAPVARHNDVSHLAQMEVGLIFASPPGLDVPGLRRLATEDLGRPIEHIAQRAREPHIRHRGSLRILPFCKR